MDQYYLHYARTWTYLNIPVLDCVSNVVAHAQKPDFVFRRNARVYLNRQGRQFSRLMAAGVCASSVVMLDTQCSEVVWRVLEYFHFKEFYFTPFAFTTLHHTSLHFATLHTLPNLDLCFSKWVTQRGIKGSERRKCLVWRVLEYFHFNP